MLDIVSSLPEFGGFNRLEKEEYYRLFIAGQDDTVKILTLASEIAEAKGWNLEETLAKLQGMESNPDASMVMELAEFLPKFLEFQEIKKQSRMMDGVKLARLMLLSRLPVSWFSQNAEALKPYGIEIDTEALNQIPRKEWLSHPDRIDAIDQLCNLLPARWLEPVEDYAINELNEGKPVVSSDDEDRDKAPLFGPKESSAKPSKPTDKKSNSGKNATSESKQAA